MSEETAAEPEAPPGEGGGKNKLIIMLVVVNLLVVAGAAVAVVLAMGSGGGAEAAPAEVEALGPLVEIDGVVVNLDEVGGSHYLRASFQLELDGEESQEPVTARLVPIRSALMLHLSGLEVADTQGEENRAEILETVATIANEQIGDEVVRRAYFTEFVAQ